MNWVQDLKILAAHSVVKKDPDYLLRNLFRWYSVKFATPLHIVETIPLEDILQHYYEVQYEECNEVELERELINLLEDENSLKSRQREEDLKEAEDFEFAMITKAEEKSKKSKQKPAVSLDKAKQIERGYVDPKPVTLSSLKQIPPDITLNFIDSDEDFEAMLNTGFGPADKKPTK